MVVTTDIPNMRDRLNKKKFRNLDNTPRSEYNCGGYALDTFSWYHPFPRKYHNLWAIIDLYEGDYSAVLHYTVNHMLKEFRGKLRVIQNLADLQENEEAVAYRIETDGYDFHYVRRKQNGSWYGKKGWTHPIYRYTEEEVFDCESDAWSEGRYNSEMILFALIVK